MGRSLLSYGCLFKSNLKVLRNSIVFVGKFMIMCIECFFFFDSGFSCCINFFLIGFWRKFFLFKLKIFIFWFILFNL